jgi:hypothetical protein
MITARDVERRTLCITLVLAILGSGCTKESTSIHQRASQRFTSFVNHAASRGKIIYDVKYQPGTVVFDEPATERAFRSVSADGSTFTLDAAEPAVRQLKEGSVLFLYGVALRKVTKLKSQGSKVAVTTTQAELTDAIKDGNIQWNVPLDFTVGATSVLRKTKTSWVPHIFAEPVYAAESPASGVSFEGTFSPPPPLSPFDYDIKFIPEGESRLKLDIDAKTADLGGAVVELKGDGYLEHLGALGKILISNGKLDAMDFSAEGFNGKAIFTWTAQQQYLPTVVKQVKLKIPGATWKYPLVIGGLPFVFEISAAIIVHPALTSKGAFSTGEFTISYDGTEGFKATSGGAGSESGAQGGTTTEAPRNDSSTSAPAEGQINKMESSGTIHHDTSIFGIGPAGFVAALELPRFELALGIMSPFDRVETTDYISNFGKSMDLVNGLAPSSAFGTYYLKTAHLLEMIEEAAFPVKPYAFANVVTSAGLVTSGMTGSVPTPLKPMPCERVQLVIAGNIGVGAHLGLEKIGLGGTVGKILSALGDVPSDEFFAIEKPVFKTTQTAYKNGVKCLGDP